MNLNEFEKRVGYKKREFMQGYRTITGLVVIILGFLGLGEFISETQVGTFIDLLFQMIGIILAIYGNHKVHRELKVRGGYR